jgi:hypothetical protein
LEGISAASSPPFLLLAALFSWGLAGKGKIKGAADLERAVQHREHGLPTAPSPIFGSIVSLLADCGAWTYFYDLC